MVKLKDLAAKTGYSVTTISRALGGFSDVNEQTRQHIIETARQLGYQPHEPARQLRSQRTQTIGLIIPANDQSFSNDFFNLLLRGIGDAAASAGYDLLISAQTPGAHEMDAYRRFVGGGRVDGMVVARTRQADERIEYLKHMQHPFAVSGRSAPTEESHFPYIDADSQAGIREATAHLIALGHREIALLLPPPELAYTEYRRRGYAEALVNAGLPYRTDYVLHGDLLRSGGYALTDDLLNRFPEITGIVCANDLMALGAMNAAQKRGLVVGHDLSITGFDDIPPAEFAHPALTTVHQPVYEIGQRLLHMLVQLITRQTQPETQILLPARLVVRESTGLRR
ncbi:MAG: LacI family DNA-binding transcriptional regulator [Chloroflexi bacterium]|uniref:LacI family DNA-binding transcriptional regulator n=1 Tax=Candidatus Flexifilum breve TaxID=3140694 RepID=UPI0031356B18|nr:LacI family DNA-binding transcriptional regulator [Chloroflexota bacterium]